ncbi:hypothetical protein OQY15_04650 [Pedobacter sp. MC2016-15]|uniref:hypothetical protein n=1 Tax=Pedobacter sp. MC2016-15 TaxID=2994473 RepID=UPI0022472294|nr:hypothetical protein [Pedobacter sp. MC2016-15]MCX2478367.1 hypothetical protein [Pedobacter sp. MC2016-15]
MPTVEIASLNSTGLGLNQSDFEFTIIEENKLKSHRGLFYDFLRQQSGTIVHLGNPCFKNQKDNGFYAGEIIDFSIDPNEEITIPINNLDSPIYDSGANQLFRFRFLDQYKADIDKLLKTALDKSPIKKIYLLTDYQFGPEKESIVTISIIEEFWQRHDNDGLIFNTLYEIYG